MIQPIVEGHGEVPAVPVLLRRLAELMSIPHVTVGRPIRRPRSNLAGQAGLTQAIELARLQPDCRAIFVLFDADDDCPKTLAPQLQTWAVAAAREIPASVVLANREYEAWFLHSLPCLLGRRGIVDASPIPSDPERIRDAKGRLEQRMQGGYSERADQPALTQATDWAAVHDRSRSARKLIKEVRHLFRACGLTPAEWPAET